MLKKQIKKIKRFSRILVETGELIFYRTFLSGNGETVDRCLVVIQNSHLGDFLLSLPFFQRLKQGSGLPLLLISDHRIKDLAEASGVFDGFIGIDFKKASSYKHLFYRWKTLGQLRKISAVKAVQCFGVGKTSFEDCMLLAVKSPDKYVFVDNFYNVQRSGTFYEALRTKFFDHPLPYRLELSLVANENNYANFITGIDQAVTVGSLECFEPLPERDESLGDYCLIIPGADDPRRRWEPEKFAKATQELAEKNPDWQLLLSGSPSEQTIVKQVYDFLPAELQKKAKIRTPDPDKLASIKRLMSDCKHAKLVLTNDTGPMHIAAKYGVKTICITGGWHWGIFAPCKEYKSVEFIYEKMSCYNCGGSCKYKTIPFKCLTNKLLNQDFLVRGKNIQ